MTNYYVSTAGSTAADGLSSATPWLNVSQVNSAPLVAGDSVLFKSGETFVDTILRITWSGSSVAPIIFSAYKTGARPILNSTGTVCIFSSAPTSHIEIRGLEVKGTSTVTNYGIQAKFCKSTIVDCVAHNAIISGICINTPSSMVTIEDCEVYDSLGTGLILDTGGTTGGIVDVTISNCVVHDNGTDQDADHGIYASGGAGRIIVQDCQLYNNFNGAGIKFRDHGSSGRISRNKIRDNRIGIVLGTQTAAGNDGHTIDNNLISSHVWAGIVFLNNAPLSGNDNNGVYNNTIVNSGHGVDFYESGNSGNVFKNNIIYCSTTAYLVKALSSGEIAAQTFDYNTYWNPDESPSSAVFYDGTARTFSYWQATNGKDANGQQADPLFVTNFSDLHLRSSSPCINAGTNVGLTQDHAGVFVPQGASPDIGAYEYVGEWAQTFRN